MALGRRGAGGAREAKQGRWLSLLAPTAGSACTWAPALHCSCCAPAGSVQATSQATSRATSQAISCAISAWPAPPAHAHPSPATEVGSVQPIAELSALARLRGILMHSDAAQSVGKVAVDVGQLGVDMLTVVGHKVGAHTPTFKQCAPCLAQPDMEAHGRTGGPEPARHHCR